MLIILKNDTFLNIFINRQTNEVKMKNENLELKMCLNFDIFEFLKK